MLTNISAYIYLISYIPLILSKPSVVMRLYSSLSSSLSQHDNFPPTPSRLGRPGKRQVVPISATWHKYVEHKHDYHYHSMFVYIWIQYRRTAFSKSPLYIILPSVVHLLTSHDLEPINICQLAPTPIPNVCVTMVSVHLLRIQSIT